MILQSTNGKRLAIRAGPWTLIPWRGGGGFLSGPAIVEPAAGETRLFLRPGARFRVVDGLLTHFHLPRSSLLLLVAAFAGRRRVMDAYAEAMRSGYRFFSYGDAMLIL